MQNQDLFERFVRAHLLCFARSCAEVASAVKPNNDSHCLFIRTRVRLHLQEHILFS